MFLLIDVTASGSGSAAKLSELARRKLAILEPQSPDEPALFHRLKSSRQNIFACLKALLGYLATYLYLYL